MKKKGTSDERKDAERKEEQQLESEGKREVKSGRKDYQRRKKDRKGVEPPDGGRGRIPRVKPPIGVQGKCILNPDGVDLGRASRR
jgi:hypothetical protein